MVEHGYAVPKAKPYFYHYALPWLKEYSSRGKLAFFFFPQNPSTSKPLSCGFFNTKHGVFDFEQGVQTPCKLRMFIRVF